MKLKKLFGIFMIFVMIFTGVTCAIATEDNNAIPLFVHNTGSIFSFVEEEYDEVDRIVLLVEEPDAFLLTKNGRLNQPLKAWCYNENFVIYVDIIEYEVFNEDAYTNPYDMLEKTFMHKEMWGWAHRLFDESKPGELVVRFFFEYNEVKYALEVWLQDELYTLRKYSEWSSETPPPVVTQPPAETTPPVVTQPPAVTPPPAVTQPPAITQPPVVTQPPTITAAPVVTQQPGVTPVPQVTQPPAITQPPALTQQPAVGQTPAPSNPVVTQQPNATPAPQVTQPPAVTAAPVTQPNGGIII